MEMFVNMLHKLTSASQYKTLLYYFSLLWSQVEKVPSKKCNSVNDFNCLLNYPF